MSAPSAQELLDLARHAAHDAGDVLLARFDGPSSGVEAKSSRTDLVSDADREAERAIIERISATRPHDAILAEEGGGGDGAGGIRWVIDPLDGTTNYLWRIPHWAVSVAAEDHDGPLVGVVFDPSRDEMFVATRGGGAFCGDARLQTRAVTGLAQALIGTGFNYSATERTRQGPRLASLLPHVRDIRRYGAAALDLAWVAAGRLDAYFETGLEEWDWKAGALLVQEAGGEIVMLPGRGGSPECTIAASQALMSEFCPLVEKLHR